MSLDRPAELPEIVSVLADPVGVENCGDTVGHDYRPHHVERASKTYQRCVWCHVIACDQTSPDTARPCVQPLQHMRDHVDRLGTRWPRHRFPKQGAS